MISEFTPKSLQAMQSLCDKRGLVFDYDQIERGRDWAAIAWLESSAFDWFVTIELDSAIGYSVLFSTRDKSGNVDLGRDECVGTFREALRIAREMIEAAQ